MNDVCAGKAQSIMAILYTVVVCRARYLGTLTDVVLLFVGRGTSAH